MSRFVFYENDSAQDFDRKFENLSVEVYRQHGKNVSCEIKPYSKGKTAEQLGYYYGSWVPAIRDYLEETCGGQYNIDDIDGLMKKKLLDERVVQIGDEVHLLPPSIAKLSVKEMSRYLDRVGQYWAERGLYLPEPRK